LKQHTDSTANDCRIVGYEKTYGYYHAQWYNLAEQILSIQL
jgi:hypothetical protein